MTGKYRILEAVLALTALQAPLFSQVRNADLASTHIGQVRNADLVFTLSDSGRMSSAITAATAFKEGPSYDHVGIIEVRSDGIYVIEALAKHGVVSTPWESFLARAPKITEDGKEVPGICVKRVAAAIQASSTGNADMGLTGKGQGAEGAVGDEGTERVEGSECAERAKAGKINNFDADAAVQRAKTYLGRPYDWSFEQDNDAIYCSELVWLTYLDPAGKPIFETTPMNFKATDGSIPEFWVKVFARLGTPIPQDKPGTSPNGLSRSPMLIEVKLSE